MPSGVNDDIADAVLDGLLGSTAGATLPDPMWLDLLTTGPSDDDGTDAVSWAQGRASVATVDGTNWPASSGRTKAGIGVLLPTNTSGSTITVVAFAWYDASTAGTYLGGAPIAGGSQDIPDGVAPTFTPTLASPSPS